MSWDTSRSQLLSIGIITKSTHCMAKSNESYLRNHRCCPANHYPTTLNCGVSARRAARLPAGALLAQ